MENTIRLYNASGKIENHNLAEFPVVPADALAIKFADEVEDGRWITDEDELRQLRREDAPLSYTEAGLAVIGGEIEEHVTYDYRNISPDGQGWIRDLMAYADETGFPTLDPQKMSAADRDRLVEYLKADDGSLSEEDMEFSRGVAQELADL